MVMVLILPGRLVLLVSDGRSVGQAGSKGRDHDGGGGDFANVTPNTVTPRVGWRDIKMKGVVYKCTATGD